MTRIPVFLAAAIALLMNPIGAFSAAPLELRCPSEDSRQAEAVRLSHSPQGGRRIGAHRLEIRWTRGKRLFVDRPPYGEPIGGVAWTYCGYSPELHRHLIRQQDRDVFTGILLDNLTGKVERAGESVRFSPDRKQYLAYEQPDGQDRSTLKLYQTGGTLLWNGYNGLLSGNGTIAAEFRDVRWDARGRLLADAVYADRPKPVTFTLQQRSGGGWGWVPAGGK